MSGPTTVQYRCGDVVYLDAQLATLFQKTKDEINARYQSGKPIALNGEALELTDITDEELPWVVGGSRVDFCEIGVPIDIVRFKACIANRKK